MTTTHAARKQLVRLAETWGELNEAIVPARMAPADGIRSASHVSAALPYDDRAATLAREIADFTYHWTRVAMTEYEVLEIVRDDDGKAHVSRHLWAPPADQSVPSLLRAMAEQTVAWLTGAHPAWFDVELDELSLRLTRALGPRPNRDVLMVRHAQMLRAIRGDDSTDTMGGSAS